MSYGANDLWTPSRTVPKEVGIPDEAEAERSRTAFKRFKKVCRDIEGRLSRRNPQRFRRIMFRA